jgi:hypothetical protein
MDSDGETRKGFVNMLHRRYGRLTAHELTLPEKDRPETES